MSLSENKLLCRNLSVSSLGGIRLSAFVKDGKGVLTPRRVLPRYTLVYVVRGDGVYKNDEGRCTEIRAHSGILVLPGQEHWYGPKNNSTWDEIFIEFEGPLFDVLRDENFLDWKSPVIELRPSDYWVNRFLDTAGESHSGSKANVFAEIIRLQSLLADIRKASRTDVVDDLRWLETAKKALLNYPGNAADAAESVGVSYEVFRKRFKKLMGTPPGKFQIAQTMETACDLLLDKKTTVREIASHLGYCDEYHFSKQFRKTIGWSPSEYRSKMSKSSN